MLLKRVYVIIIFFFHLTFKGVGVYTLCTVQTTDVINIIVQYFIATNQPRVATEPQIKTTDCSVVFLRIIKFISVRDRFRHRLQGLRLLFWLQG
jgi:hypothetical protein